MGVGAGSMIMGQAGNGSWTGDVVNVGLGQNIGNANMKGKGWKRSVANMLDPGGNATGLAGAMGWMGGDDEEGIQIPLPEFAESPHLNASMDDLLAYGQSLASGAFMNPNDERVGFLNQLVTLNPEYTKTAVNLASRDVTERRDKAQQDMVNVLAANNQLESSVTGNRIADLNQSYSSDISDIASQFYLADVERAMGNIGSLFGTGLNTLGNVGQLGAGREQRVNDFNLNNFANAFGLQYMNQNQDSGGGGLLGSLLGGGGGSGLLSGVMSMFGQGGSLGSSGSGVSNYSGNMGYSGLGSNLGSGAASSAGTYGGQSFSMGSSPLTQTTLNRGLYGGK